MTIANFLGFITNVIAYLVASDLFQVVLVGVGCMFLLISLIRLVWFLVRID